MKKKIDNRSAARALEVLELFATRSKPLFVTEIAGALEIPLSSCFGIIKTLERDGYLYSLGQRRGFYPTGKIFRIAQTLKQNDPIARYVTAPLEALRDETGETALLCHLVENEVVAVCTFESPQAIRFNAAIGDRWPVHSTSIGRSLLARLGRAERERIVASLAFADGAKVSSAEALAAAIARGEETGTHIAENETLPDLLGISRVAEVNGQLFAVTVAGPTGRLKPKLVSCAAALREACERLAEDHG